MPSRPASSRGAADASDRPHPLLATVAYSESSAEARRDVHRRLAAVVVDQEERARHLALAAEGPDEGVAAELEEAARKAAGRGAPDAAAQLSELARELTPSEHAEARIHRTVHAGQYAFEAADMGRAATLLEEAVAAAPTGWLRAEALLFLPGSTTTAMTRSRRDHSPKRPFRKRRRIRT
jgi:hypothetical protein